MITYNLKKGDLLRNKATGDIAILHNDPYVKFVPDSNFYQYGVESGTAETFFPLTYTVIQGDSPMGTGAKVNIKQSILKRNWERVCESR
tara:strand:+ start:5444 stop:5710 length:267 start_codon:yes stop_codon:yes gene_type:complete